MKRTERILDRFPSFYKTWDRNARIFKIVSALGKRVDELEKELTALLRAHWVDTAFGHELDKLGALFNLKRKADEPDPDYRTRLKRAILEYKGGGTVHAVLRSVKMALGLPQDYPLTLKENPPKEMHTEIAVKTGETWKLASASVLDASPHITIRVETKGGRVTNPSIANLETGEVVTFTGSLQSKDLLRIEDGKAFLNEDDVTGQLAPTNPPRLLRKGSTWRYKEPLEENIGVFDVAHFDSAVFAIGVPTVRIGFTWIAFQPATFELEIPKAVVPTEADLQLVQDVVDSVKAAGVKALVKAV